MGQERLGGDLCVAVDPTHSENVWIAWCDRVGGAAGTDWTLHVRQSTNRGQTWSADVRTVTNAKNPSMAVNSAGVVGLLFQQFSGTRWITQLETTADLSQFKANGDLILANLAAIAPGQNELNCENFYATAGVGRRPHPDGRDDGQLSA